MKRTQHKCINTQTGISSPYATEESDLERADGICRATLQTGRKSTSAEPKVSTDFLLASKNLSQTGDATGQGVCGELGLRAEGFALQHSLGDVALYSGL